MKNVAAGRKEFPLKFLRTKVQKFFRENHMGMRKKKGFLSLFVLAAEMKEIKKNSYG